MSNCPNCGSGSHIHCTRAQDMPAAETIVELVERVLREREESNGTITGEV
ncbi:MAG TPA: hypothetical protein VFA71_03910 [Terriglobales bacterium]|nr:hypothetical protein [Terriglobales bacterium]